jgi:hypothetical protein
MTNQEAKKLSGYINKNAKDTPTSRWCTYAYKKYVWHAKSTYSVNTKWCTNHKKWNGAMNKRKPLDHGCFAVARPGQRTADEVERDSSPEAFLASFRNQISHLRQQTKEPRIARCRKTGQDESSSLLALLRWRGEEFAGCSTTWTGWRSGRPRWWPMHMSWQPSALAEQPATECLTAAASSGAHSWCTVVAAAFSSYGHRTCALAALKCARLRRRTPETSENLCGWWTTPRGR